MNKAISQVAFFEVNSQSKGFLAAEIAVRNHEFLIDEPVALGGTDQGATPIETVIAGLASCITIIIKVVAKTMKVQVESLNVEAKAEFDLRGVKFQEEVDVPFRKVDLTINLKSDISPEQLATLQQKVKAHCPVHKLFSMAGTELIENWKLS